ncbi:ribose-phosphate pyrophosphokinase [Patescibacteria group bacterium]|nr:ribose-phosphate pyrophosphokinase [Patescibacteria group bacterium]
MNGNLLIFSGRESKNLAEKMAKHLEMPLGNLEVKRHSDGEVWCKYHQNIRGATVAIVQSTNPPAENLMELLVAIDAAKRASAAKIFAIIPYFGYARQDRKPEPRVSITAKLVANLLTTAGADRIITIDLHASQIQGFFDIPVDHVYASKELLPYWSKYPIDTVAAPDVGAVKMARAWAKRLNAELIIIDKRRPKDNEAEILNIIGNPSGKNILIVDDMIDTGGSFVGTVKALKEKDANKIYGSVVHAVLSGKAIEAIENSPIEKLVVTDTIKKEITSEKIEVISLAKLLAEVTNNAFSNKSISSMFDSEEMKK